MSVLPSSLRPVTYDRLKRKSFLFHRLCHRINTFFTPLSHSYFETFLSSFFPSFLSTFFSTFFPSFFQAPLFGIVYRIFIITITLQASSYRTRSSLFRLATSATSSSLSNTAFLCLERHSMQCIHMLPAVDFKKSINNSLCTSCPKIRVKTEIGEKIDKLSHSV